MFAIPPDRSHFSYAERLQQVVWNLVSNAVKFTPARGRIDVRLEATGPATALIVADTGIGIAPHLLSHVFDRPRQADRSVTRPYPGLGLGLAIVRHLVEVHGGRVIAESAGEGRGATFRVELPTGTARTACYTSARYGDSQGRAPRASGAPPAR